MQPWTPCMRKASSGMLLLALLAAAAASVTGRPSQQLLGDHHVQPSSMASAVTSSSLSLSMYSRSSNHAIINTLQPSMPNIHHKKKHEGQTNLPLAIHIDEHIPAAVNPNPSNPPLTLPNPSQPYVLQAVDVKHSKHERKPKSAKFDHHKELPALQLPPLSMPNPSQLPMLPAADVKLSKHQRKAMKAAAQFSAAAGVKFDHHKKDKHSEFVQVVPAAFIPNPSNPPMHLPNPSQLPVLPVTEVKSGKLSKHDKKVLKAAAQLAAATGGRIDQVTGVSLADVVMRHEPEFKGPSLLG